MEGEPDPVNPFARILATMVDARESPRDRRPGDDEAPRPIFAVWELTMKCDQPCQHRGVRERLVLKERAPQEPYDFGRLEIVEEACVDGVDGVDSVDEPTAKPARRLPLATG